MGKVKLLLLPEAGMALLWECVWVGFRCFCCQVLLVGCCLVLLVFLVTWDIRVMLVDCWMYCQVVCLKLD